MTKFGSHSWPPRKPKRHFRLALFVNGVGVILTPNERTIIMVEVTVGHLLNLAFKQVDTSGNPMLTPVTLDGPATWSNTTAATETLVPSADGTTCVATTLVAGTDEIDCKVSVGGVAFTAALQVTVDPLPQTFGGIVITAAVQ